jgi:signal transduction histidine kinase
MTTETERASGTRAAADGGRRPRRRSIRTRLTLVVFALLVVTGVALLGVNYFLISSRLQSQVDRAAERSGPDESPFEERDGTGPLAGPEVAQAPDGDLVSVRAVEERFVDLALRELVVQSVLTLLVLTFVAVGVGWLLSRRILRPVHTITDTARRLSERDLTARIALAGPDDELKELADTFDDMLDRLDTAFTGERLFIANASHELRTPLAVARTAVDVYDAKPAPTDTDARAMTAKVRGAIERSDALIRGLLVLAQAQQTELELQQVDLAELVIDELAEASATAVEIRHSLEAVRVEGDPVLLAHLVRNLLDNACRYNVEGGWVEVSTTAESGRRLRVRNSGPIVAPDRLSHLFEPFRRGDADRKATAPGAGIGLAVVRAVAERHGATLHAVAPATGGLDIEVRFEPKAPPLLPAAD